MPINKGRLIIVDPSLKDTRGHHYSLTCSVTASAAGSGYDVIVLSNISVDESFSIPSADVIPVFSKTTYDYFKKIEKDEKISLRQRIRRAILNRLPESIRQVLRNLKERFVEPPNQVPDEATSNNGANSSNIVSELMHSLKKLNVTGNDHVLVHTSDAIIYRSILKIVQKSSSLGASVNFHLCTPYDMKIMPHSSKGLGVGRVIRYLDLMGAIGRNVFLYAENDLLADSLSSEWGVEVQSLDIPMKRISRDEAAVNERDTAFKVVYLGAAREEKGFHLLPSIIENVLSRKKEYQLVEFILQCSPQIVGYTPKIQHAIKQLQKLDQHSVTLIKQQQTMDEYYQLLESADIVLLCYQQEKYKVRGSGIAAEAIAYGKNVITTSGTYPAWLAGDAGLTADEPVGIASAILNIINDHDSFVDKAKIRADWFYNKTKPEQYIEKLLANEAVSNAKKDGMDPSTKHESAVNQNAELNRDDTASKSGYNTQLTEAEVSEDGKVLFVKQISI